MDCHCAKLKGLHQNVKIVNEIVRGFSLTVNPSFQKEIKAHFSDCGVKDVKVIKNGESPIPFVVLN